ncbi:radical SAM/SPASM domain-containing protein [Carboxylicivirga caseinilyticus]|uniref:radical SAM/SPASM domain-containing protein n=1 Tax=Carboxylicivirga caseinilyticus TaxID=3417572 RepID=UPI003D33C411|nr:SPASM domain-containing protein [Marinilabiliaceae bacterium A049]
MVRIKILEAWAILRVLNFKRIANAFKTILNYYLTQITKYAIIKHQPLALSIEPTSICNLKCPECPTGTNTLLRPRGKISLVEYKKIIDQLPKELIYLNLYIQGEPTMHPDFPELIQLANNKNLYTSTSTNGHFITPALGKKIVESGLTRIIFSVDGTTQESYEKYRIGGSLHKVIEGIKNITSAKKKLKKRYPLVIIQFLVFKHNQHQLEEIKKIAKDLSVDKLEFKTAQFNNYSDSPVEPPTIERFRRYENTHRLRIKGKMLNKCWRQWHSAVITWNGKVAPCCYDKDAIYLLGDITTNNFSEIWKSKESQLFKTNILQNKKNISMCHNCPEGRSFWS